MQLLKMKKQQIGLVKTPGGYFLPGGGVEVGEDHMTALNRELQEEIGYSVSESTHQGVYGQFTLARSKPIYYELIGDVYVCKLGEFTDNQVEDDHELEWLDLDKAIQAIPLPYQQHALKIYRSNEEGIRSLSVPKSSIRKFRVIKGRESEFPNPINVKKGQRVKCIEESNSEGEWFGWILCQTTNNEGWIPQQIITKDGNFGVITENYTAEEFALNVGEVLLSSKELNGWIWCCKESDSNKFAWAPLNHITEI